MAANLATDLVSRAASPATVRWRSWAAAGFVLLGILRIVATYDDLSETVDEVAHVGAGMEWLALGSYTYELQHPPLARIAAATGPYLLGIRAQGQPTLWDEGRRVLYAEGRYRRNLTAARLGMLPFFVLAVFFVWRLGRDAFGPGVALAAVACFTLFPTVLAHFGLATTDGPFLAMFAATAYALVCWARGPTVRNGLALGVATGLAVATKLSAVAFLPAFALLLLAARLWAQVRTVRRRGAPTTESAPLGSRGEGGGVSPAADWPWRRSLVSAVVAGAAAFVVVWAAYRFSVGTVRGIPMPAPEIAKGIREVADHNRYGHPAYFLGQVRSHGVWYFFPVMLVLKTPLAALLLVATGFAVLARRAWRTVDWVPLVPLIVTAAILGVAIVARINIGVRHVLPVYIGLALAAGVAWDWAWRRLEGRLGRAALITAAAALSIGTVTIHPDYLAYFNVFAGRDPSRLVADSDLDWGQDLFRLSRVARERGVDTLRFAYIGTGDLSPIVGVPVAFWDGNGRPTGWVAVTETWYRRGQITFRRGRYEVRPDALFWLDSAATPTRVGKGIRLYRLE